MPLAKGGLKRLGISRIVSSVSRVMAYIQNTSDVIRSRNDSTVNEFNPIRRVSYPIESYDDDDDDDDDDAYVIDASSSDLDLKNTTINGITVRI
jgi:hypothetical protein